MSQKFLKFLLVSIVFLLPAGFVYAEQEPEIDSITPVSVYSNHAQFELVIEGKHFRPEAVIYIGSLAIETIRINSEELRHTFPAATLAQNVYYISVTDSNGTSNTMPLTVYTTPPTVGDLDVDSNICPIADATGAATFSFEYDDFDEDQEEQFELQIDNNSDFSSPKIDRQFTGLSNPPETVNQQAVTILLNTNELNTINYGTAYYWRVRACQISPSAELVGPNGICSDWIEGQYTTIAHPGPYVTFSVSVTSPAVTIINDSICYNASGQNACDSFLYDFDDGETFTDNNPELGTNSTTHSYTELASYEISVLATDNNNLQCEASVITNISNQGIGGLPFWKETNPYEFNNPMGCNDNGYSCVFNSDCCSGYCGLDICDNPPACSSLGQACASNAQCCSGACSGGQCVNTGWGGCFTLGTFCSDGSQCCSGLCSGTCASGGGGDCTPIGHGCTFSHECCAGSICINGFCGEDWVP